MARVYEMSASFSRKVQVKQFEPAEASFEMKVELEEGDDPTKVRTFMMQEVRDAVTQAMLGRAGKGGEVRIVQNITAPEDPENFKKPEPTAELDLTAEPDLPGNVSPKPPEPEPAKKVGRPKGSKNKPKEEVPLAVTGAQALEDGLPLTAGELVEINWDTVGEDEESNVVELKPKETEPVVELTLAQVKTLLNKVTGDGVKIPKVRDLLKQFGVASTTELDPSAYPEFYGLLTEIKDEELKL